VTTLQRLALYAAVAVLIGLSGFYAGASYSVKHQSAKAQAAQTESDQAEGAAQTHAAQAQSTTQQAAANQAAVNDADAHVAAAKRELARLKAALLTKAPVPSPASLRADGAGSGDPSRATPDGKPLPNCPGFPESSVEAQQAAVIAAQDQEIAALKLQVSIEHASAVQWKVAYDESQKALALQRIASDAAVHAAQSSGVRGALVHGLEGLALGYVAGRVTK